MRRSLRKGIAAGAALSALGLAAPAQAEALDDRFWLQVSGYWAGIDTDIQVSPASNPDAGTRIDLEDDLGLDDNEFLPAVLAGARLGSSFQIVGEYYSLGRDTTHTLERDIVIEDVTYPASASITAGFDTDIYRLTIGWAFVRQPDLQVGGAIGLHATNVALTIEGEGRIGNSGVTVQQRRQDFLAPLPTLGLFATFEPIERLTIGARIDYLSLSIGDYDGRLINMQASAAYRVFRNVGIGIAYRYVDYRVDAEKERFTGRFAYRFSGPSIFLEFGF